VQLAAPLVPAPTLAERLGQLGAREAEIIAALPHTARVH